MGIGDKQRPVPDHDNEGWQKLSREIWHNFISIRLPSMLLLLVAAIHYRHIPTHTEV